MKSKIARIMGVILIVTMLASMLMVATPVAAGADDWTKLSLPKAGADGSYFRDNTITAIGPMVKAKGDILYAVARLPALTNYSLPDVGDAFTITDAAGGDSGTITVTAGSLTVTATGAGTTPASATVITPANSPVAWGTPAAGATLALAVSAGAAATSGSWTFTTGTADAAVTTDADADGLVTAGSGIFKSADGARTWSRSTASKAYAAVSGRPVKAIAVSSEDANLLYVLDGNNTIWKSADGAGTFTKITASGLPGGTVTGIGVAYMGGVPYLFIGNRGTGTSGVWWIKDEAGGFGATLTWAALSQGAGTTQLAAGTDVRALVISPDFATSSQILAVTNEAGDIKLRFHGTNGWNTIGVLTLSAGAASSDGAAFGFPDNYSGIAGTAYLDFMVALNDGNAANNNGIYRVRATGTTTVGATAMDVSIAGDFVSVEVKGSAGAYTGVAGNTAGRVAYISDLSTNTWKYSSKNPSGNANVYAVAASDFATSLKAWAAVNGTEQAVSISRDGGKNFNQISLIDSDFNAVNEIAFSPNYATDKVMYVVATDVAGANSVWKYDGTNWERVLVSTISKVTTGSLNIVALSPAGDALFVGDNVAPVGLYRSTDGGNAFSLQTNAPGELTALAIINKDTIIAGGTGTTYKTTNNGDWAWSQASQKPSFGKIVKSLVLSPNFSADNTILLGNDAGEVWRSTDAGANWGTGKIGTALAVGNTFVAFDPNYATNNTIYAGAVDQIDRIVIAATAADTKQTTLLDAGTDTDTTTAGVQPVLAIVGISGVEVSSEGVIYASDIGAGGLKGVVRSLTPTTVKKDTDTQADFEVARGWENVTKTSVTGGMAQLPDLHRTTGSAVLWGHETGNIWTYTDNLVVSPTLDSPANGIILPTTNQVTLTWKAVTNAADYDFKVNTKADFTGIDITSVAANYVYTKPETSAVVKGTQAAAGAAVAAVDGLQANTTYYWRVRVKTANPVKSLWSEVRTFSSSLEAPAAPAAVVSPAAGAQDVSTMPMFTWGAVTGATGYEIQLGSKPDFSDAVTKTTTLSFFVWPEALNNSQVYYWRVRATTATGQSSWLTRAFATVAKSTAAVTPTPTFVLPTPTAPAVTTTVTVTPAAPPAPPASTIIIPAPPAATVTQPAPAPVTVTAPPPIVNIPAQPAPTYIWAVVAIGAILVIAVIVLIIRTRRVS